VSRLVALYGLGLAALVGLVALAVVDPWAADGGGPPDAAAGGDVAGAVTFELAARGGSGEFGFATLEPRGEGTRLAVELLSGTAARAFVREGTCRLPGERLHDVGVVTRRAGGDVASTAVAAVALPPDELRGGRRVVTVERRGAVVACARISG
jgi:hypothetical protein